MSNFDGSKVVFAMRAQFIEDADEEDQPTWNIWEYDVDDAARCAASSPRTPVEDEGHDIMPHYLPDGRIVFSSTRQRQSRAILLDENKPQYAAQDEDDNEPAFVLHVMDADGTNIHQISFNQSHDLDPAVLANGQIVFTRWEQRHRRQPVRSVQRQSGRLAICSCCTARTAMRPAPPIRHRHRRASSSS